MKRFLLSFYDNNFSLLGMTGFLVFTLSLLFLGLWVNVLDSNITNVFQSLDTILLFIIPFSLILLTMLFLFRVNWARLVISVILHSGVIAIVVFTLKDSMNVTMPGTIGGIFAILAITGFLVALIAMFHNRQTVQLFKPGVTADNIQVKQGVGYAYRVVVSTFVAIVFISILAVLILNQLKPQERTGNVPAKPPYEIPPPDMPRTKPVNLDWNLTTLEGNPVNVNKLTKDKVLFLNFWATWCKPCVMEIPSIEKLYSHYKDRMIFVCASDESKEKLDKFLEKTKHNFPVYRYEGKLPDELETRGIPATFIINKERVIALKHVGAANWAHESVKSFLDDMLGEKRIQ